MQIILINERIHHSHQVRDFYAIMRIKETALEYC